MTIRKTAVLDEIFREPGPWYSVEISEDWPDHGRDIVLWCLQTFGTDHFGNWAYNLPRDQFFFKREADRTLFLLRWS